MLNRSGVRPSCRKVAASNFVTENKIKPCTAQVAARSGSIFFQSMHHGSSCQEIPCDMVALEFSFLFFFSENRGHFVAHQSLSSGQVTMLTFGSETS